MNNFTADDLNVTSSPSTLCSAPIKTPAATIIKSVIYSVIALVSLVGNSLVLLSVRKKKMKTTMDVFIVNMAASDLFFPVLLIPRLLASEISGSQTFLIQGLLGSFLCKISNFLTDVSVSVSTHSLVLITIERFVAVVFPFKIRQLSTKLRFYAIVVVWIIAFGIHSPYFYTFRLTETGECEDSWEPAFNHELTHSRYYPALFVVVVIVPFTVVTILYGAIVWTLIFTKNKPLVYFSCKEASKKKKESSEMRVLKKAATVVLAFALCWAPFNVIQFLYIFAPGKLSKCSLLHSVAIQASLVLAVAYCTVNPVICFVYSRNYHFRESLASFGSQLKSSYHQKETEL